MKPTTIAGGESNIFTFAYTACLLLALSCSPITGASIDHVVMPSESISATIHNKRVRSDFKPRYSLYAERADSNETEYMARVREAVPAVTSQTITMIQDGKSSYVNQDDVATILVSDEADVLALIAVEKKRGNVNGIVQKNGGTMKFTQRGGGGNAISAIAEAFDPPAWSCGFTPDMERRFLFEDGHDDNHKHSHHHHSDHPADHHDFIPSTNEEVLADIKHSLRGSELRFGKRRRVQGESYAHWVDVFVEIDYTLCTDCATEIGPNTINYINTLFTGANTIYESEINTHLNVLAISVSTDYDSAKSFDEVLTKMQNTYSGDSWHYTSPSGVNPDLHHAILGKDLGGGVALMVGGGDVLCNPDAGFGVSTGLNGDFVSMGNSVIWDMKVLMHEIGHNFGSPHTHDFSPQVDSCGSDSCSGLPLAKSSTIMSYCHICDGGLDNIDYTFGGKYNGSGDRSDVNSYYNSPLAGTVSYEPRRVTAKMNAHVSSRGTCTQPPGTATTAASAITIQAEDYSNMQGIKTEGTTDEGGGMNVGSIETGDWMSYPEVNIPSAGPYMVEYRVSSESGGGILQLEKAGGTPVYGTIDVPVTGDWQAWVTISHAVNLESGPQHFGIVATVGGWNLNWFRIILPITIQAEEYSDMLGVKTEGTTDEGGGMNVGSIDTGDWLFYPEVNIPSAGPYIVEYRVSSESGGGILQFERGGGAQQYGTIEVPVTGDWQAWVTISHTVNLESGPQHFGIVATVGGWNLNWFRITKAN